MKICIVAVYFGSLPTYFTLWVKSVKHNPGIDFIVYTDDSTLQRDLPGNLTIKRLTLPNLKQKAEKELGFSVSLEKPYKCCDFKPVYGLIFKEDLEGYDYWGHCDLDMIFGDLQSYIEQYSLADYDRFLTMGHLSFFKNTEPVNRRYKDEGSFIEYRAVFSSPVSYAFDEFNGISSIYIKNGYPMFKKRVFIDISPSHNRFTLSTLYKYDQIPENYKYQVFCWDGGKVYHEYYLKGRFQREEYAYIHFQKRGNLEIHFDDHKCDSFYITKNGFFAKTKQTGIEEIKKYNSYPGMVIEEFESVRVKLHNFLVLLKIKLRLR